jgi:hypothetical protein
LQFSLEEASATRTSCFAARRSVYFGHCATSLMMKKRNPKELPIYQAAKMRVSLRVLTWAIRLPSVLVVTRYILEASIASGTALCPNCFYLRSSF